MNGKRCTTFLALLVLALLAAPCTAYAQSSADVADEFRQTEADTLRRAVAELQGSPDDQTLREKIIHLAEAMHPRPEIPEEARQHGVRGDAFAKDAQNPSDFQLAVKEYQQALLLAPWWGAAYYDEGVALQSAGQFDEAIADLNLYLLTNPADAAAVNDSIIAIGAEKELAAKHAQEEEQQKEQQQQAAEQEREQQEQAAEQQQQAIEQQQQAALQAAQEKLVGKWNFYHLRDGSDIFLVISRDGTNYSASFEPDTNSHRDSTGLLGQKFIITSFAVIGTDEIKFTETDDDWHGQEHFGTAPLHYDLRLSDDGSELKGTQGHLSNEQVRNHDMNAPDGYIVNWTATRAE